MTPDDSSPSRESFLTALIRKITNPRPRLRPESTRRVAPRWVESDSGGGAMSRRARRVISPNESDDDTSQ